MKVDKQQILTALVLLLILTMACVNVLAAFDRDQLTAEHKKELGKSFACGFVTGADLQLANERKVTIKENESCQKYRDAADYKGIKF